MILETKEENIIIREKDNFEKLCVSFLAHSFFFVFKMIVSNLIVFKLIIFKLDRSQ